MQWEYSYSSPISCERIREHCFTILPVRQHEVFLAAVERASHIVNEWNLAVNGTAQNDFSGAEDDLWGVMHTLFTPESIPERLVHATQLSQLLFLVDGRSCDKTIDV